MAASMDADCIIRTLGLEPHPEGGFFRETFRDSHGDAAGRAASTAIYFLLQRGEVSRWHRVDAAEVWHWYAGAPLALARAAPGHAPHVVTLGPNLLAGQRPQAVIEAGHWQQACSLGDWTLAGCTVAPGFVFDKFELAPKGFVPG